MIAPEAQDLVVPEIKTDRQKSLPHPAVRGDAARARPPAARRLRSRPRRSTATQPAAPRDQLGRSAGRTDRRRQEPAGSRNCSPTTAAASRSTSSPRGAARSLRGRDWRSSICTRDARAARGLMASRSITSSTSSNASSRPKRPALTHGPALVKGSFVDGKEGSSYTARRLVAVAPVVPLEVSRGPVAEARDVLRRNRQLSPGGLGESHLAARGRPAHAHARHRTGPGQRIARPDLGTRPRGNPPARR